MQQTCEISLQVLTPSKTNPRFKPSAASLKELTASIKTHGILTREPYAGSITSIEPLTAIAAEDAATFECSGSSRREPHETKLGAGRADVAPGSSACGPGDCC